MAHYLYTTLYMKPRNKSSGRRTDYLGILTLFVACSPSRSFYAIPLCLFFLRSFFFCPTPPFCLCRELYNNDDDDYSDNMKKTEMRRGRGWTVTDWLTVGPFQKEWTPIRPHLLHLNKKTKKAVCACFISVYFQKLYILNWLRNIQNKSHKLKISWDTRHIHLRLLGWLKNVCLMSMER